jgi:hypothetical protein
MRGKTNLNLDFPFFTGLVADAAVAPSLNEITGASFFRELEVCCKRGLFSDREIGARLGNRRRTS